MAIQFTIIGLGQIGSSIGLGLGAQKTEIKRVGHDRSHETARTAQKIGAVDSLDFNLPSSVENADVILLCTPADELKETFTYIAPDLKPDAIIMDFSSAKVAATKWAKEILPENSYYVGLTCGINPDYLFLNDEGVNAARVDLFQRGTMYINAPQGTPESVAQLATNLAGALGAKAVFVDTEEADSLMAAIHLLPQLTATALLDMTIDRSGWRESRAVAGRIFAQATSALVEEHGLSESAVLNKKHTLRTLDTLIESLQSMRTEIENEDITSLNKKIVKAREGYVNWELERHRAEWMGEAPKQETAKFSTMIKQFFVGDLFKKRSEDS